MIKTQKTILIMCLFAFGTAFTFSEEKKKTEKDDTKAVDDYARIVTAMQGDDIKTALKLARDSDDGELKQMVASYLQKRGVNRFFAADIAGSLKDFDEVIALLPKQDPYHWQRGISYYYADQFKEGKAQFERHQTVNDQDVENAVWHFLCAVRTKGGTVEAARKDLIPITQDTRVPMKEVHDLFAGTGTEEGVLKAADEEGDPRKSDRAKNAQLYAHLYLALYYEAIGKDDLMKKHIARAAGEFRMDHYMGKVAQVHAKLREVEIAE